jgi:hypothetical protein
MATRPKLKPLALILLIVLLGFLAAGNYFVLTQAPFGSCTLGGTVLTGADLRGYEALSAAQVSCLNYVYYFVGAPLVVGLLLLLILPNLVKAEATPEVAKPTPAPVETKKPTPSPAPARPTTDAAVQLLALFQREGRLVDFLREDIQPYDDAQIGAAVRTIHQACRQVLAEHLTLEPVLNKHEGEEVEVPKDFDPSAIRLTGNISGEPPFQGTVRHPGWRATHLKLPTQPSGQDPKIVAPAEVEIP